jgi:hypothetical protein
MADRKALVLNGNAQSQVPNADNLVVGAGITTATGNLTINSNGGTVNLASSANLTAAGGTSAVDLSAASGLFKTPTGAVTIGPGAVTVSGATTFTAAGSAVTVNNDAVVTGATYANGGVDRSTAAALSIGTTNASAVNISKIGALTTIKGNLQVDGTETVVGTSTFQDSATFEGNVTFGNAATDTVAFISRVGPSGNQDIHFVKELDHVIDVDASTTAATAGGALTMRSGNGNGAAGGALTLDTGSGSAGGALSIGATNAASVGIGRSGITTTVTGGLSQVTGALNLTANAASVVSTSSGALNLDGAAGVNLKGGATTALAINSAGTAVTVQAGAILGTTGSGNINLPNNGSARFQVEGSAVGSTVTAANLDTLTNGSNADSLHVHAAGAATNISLTGTSGEAIDAGELVAIANSGGNPRLFRADAANGTAARATVIGVSGSTVGASGSSVTVYVAGERSIPDAQWDSVPAAADVGSPAFMSATVGSWTLTAPTSGTYQQCGIVTQGGTGAVKVALGVQARIAL